MDNRRGHQLGYIMPSKQNSDSSFRSSRTSISCRLLAIRRGRFREGWQIRSISSVRSTRGNGDENQNAGASQISPSRERIADSDNSLYVHNVDHERAMTGMPWIEPASLTSRRTCLGKATNVIHNCLQTDLSRNSQQTCLVDASCDWQLYEMERNIQLQMTETVKEIRIRGDNRKYKLVALLCSPLPTTKKERSHVNLKRQECTCIPVYVLPHK